MGAMGAGGRGIAVLLLIKREESAAFSLTDGTSPIPQFDGVHIALKDFSKDVSVITRGCSR